MSTETEVVVKEELSWGTIAKTAIVFFGVAMGISVATAIGKKTVSAILPD